MASVVNMGRRTVEYTDKTKMVIITFSVSNIHRQFVDELVELGYFSNRSEALRYALNQIVISNAHLLIKREKCPDKCDNQDIACSVCSDYSEFEEREHAN